MSEDELSPGPAHGASQEMERLLLGRPRQHARDRAPCSTAGFMCCSCPVMRLATSMPSPNGFEILESLAETAGRLPVVVMLTGHDHPSIERRALELRAAAVVGKTTSMRALLDSLDETLVQAGRLPGDDLGN